MQAGPVAWPIGRGPVLPISLSGPASDSITPGPFTQVPFIAPPDQRAQLAVYDLPRKEILYYPGTGPGIENVATFVPGQYLYDDRRNLYLFDAWREERVVLVDGKLEVGGFAFFPSMSGDAHLYFLGQSDPALAARGIGFAYVKYDTTVAPVFGDLGGATSSATSSPSPSPNSSGSPSPSDSASPEPSESESPAPSPTPTPLIDQTKYATVSTAPAITVVPGAEITWYLAKPRFLTKINALAARHGGVTSIAVDGLNTLVVFTTADGGLYLYTPQEPQVTALLPNQTIVDNFHAGAASIDTVWGRFVVWNDTLRRGLFCLDLWTGHIDVMPYANLALDAVAASAPVFVESDPFNVIFLVTLKDGTFRVICYNIVTEQVLNLSLLNDFLTSFPFP
ncbi:MAG TPA: hypothetical protein V6D05_07405 [Stenomitos sp.]